MTAPRRDLLAECNTERVPFAEFQEGWCRRCINPECSRSLFGQSRFDLRVNSWEDRLFKAPSRMDPADPRYKGIASKRFLSLDTGPTPEIRSWVDPHDPPKVVALPAPLPVATPAVEPPAPAAAPAAEPVTAPAVAAMPPAPLPVMNAPSQGGKMLGQPSAAPPTSDPWAAPVPAKNIVPVGGRVKLGGGGV
jgi:hypothetical protein